MRKALKSIYLGKKYFLQPTQIFQYVRWIYLTMTDWRDHSRMAYLRGDPGTLNAQISPLGLSMLTPRLNITSVKKETF